MTSRLRNRLAAELVDPAVMRASRAAIRRVEAVLVAGGRRLTPAQRVAYGMLVAYGTACGIGASHVTADGTGDADHAIDLLLAAFAASNEGDHRAANKLALDVAERFARARRRTT